MASFHLFIFIFLIKAVTSSPPPDRCMEADYSLKVCRAIRSYFSQRRPCDNTENQKLKAQIKLLRVALNDALSRQSSNVDCPGTTYQGDCYFFLDRNGYGSLLTHEHAQRTCNENQGRLVCIDSKGLYDHLYKFIERSSNDVINESRKLVLMWTGATYENGRVILEDNRTSDFSRWSSHHPINATGQNHIGLAVATASQIRGMFNASPSMKMYPLCKKNPRASPCK